MILEYLCQQDMTLLAGADERPYFAPDSTALEVPLLPAVNAPGNPSNYLRNGQSFRYFDYDDNVRVLSIGIVFPYSYSISSNWIAARPIWKDDKLIPTIGSVGEFTGDFTNITLVRMPYDGAEFPVDVTIPHKSPGQKVAFSMWPEAFPSASAIYVSMINAPSKLDFAVTRSNLHAWFFWKVAHTLPMVAG